MRNAVCLVVVCVCLASCGGGDAPTSPTATPTATPTVETWPPNIPTAMAPLAKAHLDDALLTMKNRSLKRASVDWHTVWVQAYARVGAAQSVEAVAPGVVQALGQLGDNAAVYRTPNGTWYFVGSSGPRSCWTNSYALEGLPSDVGYIYVGTQWGDGTQARGVQERMRTLDRPGLAGWIVDLRHTAVDSLWAALAALGPLLGEGDVGFFIDTDDTVGGTWRYVDGAALLDGVAMLRLENPYRPSQAYPKTVVLTDASVSGRAEAVAVALRGRPNTLTIGEPTCGNTDYGDDVALATGGKLVLSLWKIADRSGRRYEGPVPPDEVVVGYTNLKQRAVAWLRQAAPAAMLPQ